MLAALLATATAAWPTRAHAHGGLPISQQILFAAGTAPSASDPMLVPTPYWGIFVGSESGPWRWICDEAINPNNQQRRVALGSDGTVLYATDQVGLTVSTDSGCSWAAVAAPMSMLDVVSVVTDASAALPKRVLVLANSSADATKTGLWQSDDAGASWKLLRGLGEALPGGLAVSLDGKLLAIMALSRTVPRQATLHYSKDGGATFASRALTVQAADLNGETLIDLTPLWFDTDAGQSGALYLRAGTSTGHMLFRLAAVDAGDPARTLAVPTTLYSVTRDPQSHALLAATAQGIYRQAADQSWSLQKAVSSAQCLSPRGDKLFVCAWNYTPDMAAVARLEDTQQRAVKLFQYHETKGPIECPAGTPVARICPAVWASYADQLGVVLTQPGMDMAGPATQPGSGCQVGAHRGSRAADLSLGALALALAGVLGLRRRRASDL